jgi:hypothetical protein
MMKGGTDRELYYNTEINGNFWRHSDMWKVCTRNLTLLNTVIPRYNRQDLDVHDCKSLETLLHQEGFVVRKLFKIKKNPNIKTFIYILCLLCVLVVCSVDISQPYGPPRPVIGIALPLLVMYPVLYFSWLLLRLVTADISDNGHSVPPISLL